MPVNAYETGTLLFRDLTFRIDRRAYVTDPELTHLVDLVAMHARLLSASLGRPAVVLEVGVGCGSLSIALKHELRDAVRCLGADIDPSALELARDNVAAFSLDVELVESDVFSGIADGIHPDIVFGDPPWGDFTTLYDADRDEAYYRAMPSASVLPPNGRIGVHESIVAGLLEKRWGALALLNVGVLTEKDLAPLFAAAPSAELLSSGPLRVFACRL